MPPAGNGFGELLVVEISKRGKLISGDPFFVAGSPVVLEKKGSNEARPGDLAVVRTSRGRAHLVKVLGEASSVDAVIEGLLVEKGELPAAWRLSDDPERLVPLMLPETQWLIVVSGDPLRNRSSIYRQNFKQGYATSRKIELSKLLLSNANVS